MEMDELDEETNGLQKGTMTLIVGRPSAGKSICIVNLARVAALQKRNVVIFSLEMDAQMYTTRWDACVADINHNALRDGKLSAEERAKLIKGYEVQRNEMGVVDIVDTAGSVSPAFVRAKLDERERILGLRFDVAFVDHASMMVPSQFSDNDSLNQGSVARELRDIARAKRLPIVVALQRKQKAVEKKKRAGPEEAGTGEDVYRSDMWFQFADTMVVLHQPTKETDQQELWFKAVKVRGGKVTSWRAFKRFENMRLTHKLEEGGFVDESVDTETLE
jgi:replicative DNA helicase